MKAKLILLLVVLIIVSLTFLGCKSQLTEKIAELEGKLAEEENEIVQEEVAEVEEVEAPPAVITDTMPVEETATEEVESGDEESDTTTDSDIEKVAPTISLKIYEGPSLDESICYYRIEAIVTGSPNPTVSFSKDDSGGAWGANKAQVNLNDPSDMYTLTATATNSEGSATASIDLSWGCEIPDPDPDPDPKEKTVDIGADSSLSGFIIVDYAAYQGGTAVVGDNTFDKPIKAYLSFDISSISSLDYVTIKDVSVTIPVTLIINHPELAGSELHIKVFYYGDSLDYPQDQVVGGELVKTISTTDSLTDLNFSSSKLADELQKAADVDRQWFQLKIGLSGVLANGKEDYYMIPASVAVLHVKYEGSSPVKSIVPADNSNVEIQ